MPEPVEKAPRNRSLILIALGALLALIGLVLAIGGAWLAILGGSLYYLLVGLALAASGYFLIRGRILGAWIYLIAFALTILWAFWEVGLNGWALVPRVVGPAVLAVLVLLALPLLQPERWRWRTALAGAAGVLVALIAGTAVISLASRSSPGPMPGLIAAAMSDPARMQAGADWPAYGGTDSARRYSPLAQITPDNVGQLERAWTYNTRDLPGERYGAETTPIKVGDSLYLCSARNVIIALDAVTGRERWRHDPRVSDEAIPYTAACRGVTYYAVPGADSNSLCAARIVEGTLDARIIAVDARTGRPCPGFGANGQVDIRRGMGPVDPGMVSITSPPTIVRG